MSIKLATYNVNGINARLTLLLRWLAEEQPDIVCLQELKAPQEKFPEKAILESGYESYFIKPQIKQKAYCLPCWKKCTWLGKKQ